MSYRIGLLYTKGDQFALRHSELFVGPMSLEKAHFYRFTNKDIKDSMNIDAEYFNGGVWERRIVKKFDLIFDYSVVKSKRTTNEKQLLKETRHTQRIDISGFELLKILSLQDVLSSLVTKTQKVKTQKEVLQRLENEKKIVLKSSMFDSPHIITLEQNSIEVETFFETKKFTLEAFEDFLEKKLSYDCFIQEFILCKTVDNRSIAFDLVVHRRSDNTWLSPHVRAILSTQGELASLHSGGEFVGTPLLLDTVNYFDFPKNLTGKNINYLLQKLTVWVAQWIQSLYVNPLTAVRFRVVLDKTFTPKIINIEPQTNAQSSPGRNLEFYRHLTEFALDFIQIRQEKNQLLKTLDYANREQVFPTSGVTFRSSLTQVKIDAFMKELPLWVDLSLGHGGQELLNQLYTEKLDAKPFISLKIGNALTSRVNDKSRFQSIVTLEDYIGKGLLDWSEVNYMRSIRLPLLQRQFEQLSQLTNGHAIDLLWLDEIDLGARGLSSTAVLEVFQETISWVESLCKRGQAAKWGINFFNARNKDAFDLLMLLEPLLNSCEYFGVIGTRMKSYDGMTLKMLKKLSYPIVLFSEEISIEHLEPSLKENVTILNVYTPKEIT